MAALQTIPRDFYDVARVEGASAFQTFRNVTLPSIKGILVIVTILKLIWTLNNFQFIYLTTGGGPGYRSQTIPIFIHKLAWRMYLIGQATATSVIMTSIIMGFFLLMLKASKVREGEH